MVKSRSKAKPATRAAAHAHATTAAATLTALGFITLVATTSGTWPRWALQRNHQICGNRIEIERLTNEGAQRYDQFLGMDEFAGGKLMRGTRCQSDLFLGAEQNDVGQGRFDRVPDPACPIRAR